MVGYSRQPRRQIHKVYAKYLSEYIDQYRAVAVQIIILESILPGGGGV